MTTHNLNSIWKASNVETEFKKESIDGIPFPVFKSAIQKFLRRDECAKGLGTLRLLQNLEGDSPESTKLISNIINRLVVMMSEEVSVNNPALPALFKQYYDKFTETRDYRLIYLMYNELCNSGKCRLLNDLKTTFNLRPYPVVGTKKFHEIHKKIIELEGPPLSDLYNLKLTEDETLCKIKTNLLIGSYDTFTYLSYYMLKDFPIAKIWKLVIECSSKEAKPSVEALKFFYTKMTHAEKPFYLYHAVLLVVLQNSLDFGDSGIENIPLEFEYPMKDGKFPDYVYDIHTGNKEKDGWDFATEGAYIENEDTTFKIERYRKHFNYERQMMYNKLKILVIVPAGEKSVHLTWWEPSVDMAVIWYSTKHIPEEIKKKTNFMMIKKGPKWELVRFALKNIDLTRYDYVWIPDDDLKLVKGSVTLLCETMKKYDLCMAQPSLTDKHVQWKALIHREGEGVFRQTNFVEIQSPCFSKKGLEMVMPTLLDSEIKSGWGLDHIWSNIFKKNNCKIGVVDSVIMEHIRYVKKDPIPVVGKDGVITFVQHYQGGVDPFEEMKKTLDRYKVKKVSPKEIGRGVHIS